MPRIETIAADTPFGERLVAGFGYPLRGAGLATCTALTLAHYAGFLPAVGTLASLLVWAATWHYAADCLLHTAHGYADPPDVGSEGNGASGWGLTAIHLLLVALCVLAVVFFPRAVAGAGGGRAGVAGGGHVAGLRWQPGAGAQPVELGARGQHVRPGLPGAGGDQPAARPADRAGLARLAPAAALHRAAAVRPRLHVPDRAGLPPDGRADPPASRAPRPGARGAATGKGLGPGRGQPPRRRGACAGRGRPCRRTASPRRTPAPAQRPRAGTPALPRTVAQAGFARRPAGARPDLDRRADRAERSAPRAGRVAGMLRHRTRLRARRSAHLRRTRRPC